jgi:hypothetical protein
MKLIVRAARSKVRPQTRSRMQAIGRRVGFRNNRPGLSAYFELLFVEMSGLKLPFVMGAHVSSSDPETNPGRLMSGRLNGLCVQL